MEPSPDLIHSPLIKTKLSPPQQRNSLVPRPRLLSLISDTCARTLTLICAPAGYGKTTLLTEWIAYLSKTKSGKSPAIGWLSLDAGDNDPTLFLNYLVSALESGNMQISGETRAMLASFPPMSFQTVLGTLINSLCELTAPIFLVLDDYQFITNSTIHEGMAFFLERLPVTAHVFIASRSDPPLPLARLRVLNLLTEVRAEALRFSQEEADVFLNQVMNLSLSPKNIAVLENRTEGWIAGLQMAALAMHGLSGQRHEDLPRFIQEFSGSHHYILDYLVEEILSRQPEHIRNFLLQTSILDRLCDSLCDAVLDQDTTPPSQEILEHIEKENLFLIALDDQRRWFRYHHLFSDLLRTRLEHLFPEEVSRLHLRASAWHEKNQWMAEAVSHALSAKDTRQAGRLINQLAESMIAQSGSYTLMQWIQSLPDAYVCTQPWLCIALGWAYGFQGFVNPQEDYLREAENHIQPEDPLLLQNKWRAHIYTLRSMIASTRGDFLETVRIGNLALDLISPENVIVRIAVGFSLGRTYMSLGNFILANDLLWKTSRLCMETGIHYLIAPTIVAIAKAYRLQGRLYDTVESLRDVQNYIEEHHPNSIYSAYCAFLGTIDVLREWNQLEDAEALARKSLKALEPWNSQNCICACAVLLARIYQAEAKWDEAQNVFQSAAQAIEKQLPYGDIRADLNAAQVNFWLATGKLPLAEHWVEEWLKTYLPDAPFSITKEQDEITYARVLIAKQQAQEALKLLSRLALSAEAGGRNGRLIEILVLQAKCLYQQEEVHDAFYALEKCLTLAKPEGYLRIFLDAGNPMKELLLAYWQRSDSNLKEYVQKIISNFSLLPSSSPAGVRPTGLVEPLTTREQEVLCLVALGCSNRQIAEKLIIAEGTVKYYMHVILEKLDVQNRTQAIAKARNLKLI
jgi:LuxR family transcriptional regulator, maltose regulon positive regulatory protein